MAMKQNIFINMLNDYINVDYLPVPHEINNCTTNARNSIISFLQLILRKVSFSKPLHSNYYAELMPQVF